MISPYIPLDEYSRRRASRQREASLPGGALETLGHRLRRGRMSYYLGVLIVFRRLGWWLLGLYFGGLHGMQVLGRRRWLGLIV